MNNELNLGDFKKIIARRDARYDGRYFFGVRTTKIYCRMSCPARPKAENILVFKSASQAERSGYRPCLRCRPDAAPGSRILDGTSNTVGRALRIIESSDDDHISVEILAEKLGVSDRHLRRLFDEHLGASPIEIMTTRRLHLAKRLVTSTQSPISEIAFAAGFQSVRRFNDAFKLLFDRTPTAFRKTKKSKPAASELSLTIRPPYDWKTVLAYLKRHEAFGIEKVENETYVRFKVYEGRVATVTVQLDKTATALKVSMTGVPLTEYRSVLRNLRRVFDSDHNPIHLPARGGMAKRLDGIRVPGSFDPFEIAVSIILSQLVSTEHAKANLKSLIVRFGAKAEGQVMSDEGHNGEKEIYEFPRPNVLKDAPLEEIGLTRVKAGAIRELARQVEAKETDLGPTCDLAITREKLLSIRGIGPWTTEMIAMRCLGDPDAFPRGDLIVQRVLKDKPDIENDWSTMRAYLTHCLWRDTTNPKGRK